MVMSRRGHQVTRPARRAGAGRAAGASAGRASAATRWEISQNLSIQSFFGRSTKRIQHVRADHVKVLQCSVVAVDCVSYKLSVCK